MACREEIPSTDQIEMKEGKASPSFFELYNANSEEAVWRCLGRENINTPKFFTPTSPENADITKRSPSIVPSYSFTCQQLNRTLVFFVLTNTSCRGKITQAPTRGFLGETYGVRATHSLPEQMGCQSSSHDQLLFCLITEQVNRTQGKRIITFLQKTPQRVSL